MWWWVRGSLGGSRGSQKSRMPRQLRMCAGSWLDLQGPRAWCCRITVVTTLSQGEVVSCVCVRGMQVSKRMMRGYHR